MIWSAAPTRSIILPYWLVAGGFVKLRAGVKPVMESELMAESERHLYLCGGAQSSGSTVISWCFLQRADMDGIFDARNDVLPSIPHQLARPLTWCKFTISSFRIGELKAHFEDDGWTVHPLLVVRDVRAVFNSIIKKPYGCNGTTAEEPPIRFRLLRFRDDWRLFRENGWPMIRYESLVCRPVETLKQTCCAMNIPWDEAMLTWPKQPGDISLPVHGNPTFRKSRGVSFTDTVDPSMSAVRISDIPPGDLTWLEREFAEFNRFHAYDEHARPGRSWPDPDARAVPRYENTRRYRRRAGNFLSHALNRVLGQRGKNRDSGQDR